MTTLHVKVRMDNAAFEDNAGTEVAVILRDLANRYEGVSEELPAVVLRDSNGNTVGTARITESR